MDDTTMRVDGRANMSELYVCQPSVVDGCGGGDLVSFYLLLLVVDSLPVLTCCCC